MARFSAGSVKGEGSRSQLKETISYFPFSKHINPGKEERRPQATGEERPSKEKGSSIGCSREVGTAGNAGPWERF